MHRFLPRFYVEAFVDPEERVEGSPAVGPTTSHAFMQAVGIVNDNLDGCSFRARAERSAAHLRAAAGCGQVSDGSPGP